MKMKQIKRRVFIVFVRFSIRVRNANCTLGCLHIWNVHTGICGAYIGQSCWRSRYDSVEIVVGGFATEL